MSFVCSVCHDVLSNSPDTHHQQVQVQGAPSDVFIVATKCGHLYHRSCLDGWLNKQRNPRQVCPYCQNIIQSNELLRIFPTGDEDTDNIETANATAKTAQRESENLKTEMNQMEIILAETATRLESVNLAHDILSFEFAQKTSEFDKLLAEKEEEQAISQAIKKNLEESLEGTKNDKAILEQALRETRNQLELRQQEAEDERQRRERDERLNEVSSSSQEIYERLQEELRNLQRQFNSSLLSSPAPVVIKPTNSTASQTDEFLQKDPFYNLNRSQIFQLCIEFLEKERMMINNEAPNDVSTSKSASNRTILPENRSNNCTPSSENNSLFKSPFSNGLMTSSQYLHSGQMNGTEEKSQSNGMNDYYQNQQRHSVRAFSSPEIDQVANTDKKEMVLLCDGKSAYSPAPLTLNGKASSSNISEDVSSVAVSLEEARRERQRQYYNHVTNN